MRSNKSSHGRTSASDRAVDAVVSSWAQLHSAIVEDRSDGTPARVITWRDEKASYSVSVAFNEHVAGTVSVWAAGWRDDKQRAKRRVLQLRKVCIKGPVGEEKLREIFDRKALGLRTLSPRLMTNVTGKIKDHRLGLTGLINEVQLDPAGR